MMRRNKEDKFPGKVTLVEEDVGGRRSERERLLTSRRARTRRMRGRTVKRRLL